MASYRGHLAFASVLGAAYGVVGALKLDYDWGRAVLAGGLTTIGGLLPDLDSDSGVPVRELFGLTATCAALLAHEPLRHAGFNTEQTLVLMGGLYVLIRFVLSGIFKHWTVHRGMFHSIPALLIAGLIVYLPHRGRPLDLRFYLAGAVMLGFFSHLLLDELYSVDFMGLRLRLNRYAGSALKLASKSVPATLLTYTVLGGLGYLAWLDWQSQ